MPDARYASFRTLRHAPDLAAWRMAWLAFSSGEPAFYGEFRTDAGNNSAVSGALVVGGRRALLHALAGDRS